MRILNQLMEQEGQGSPRLWRILKDAASLVGLDPNEVPTVLHQSADTSTCTFAFELFSESELGHTLELPFCLFVFNTDEQLLITFASAFCWKAITKNMDLKTVSPEFHYQARLKVDKMLSSIFDSDLAMSCLLKNALLIHSWNQFLSSEEFSRVIQVTPRFTFNKFRTKCLALEALYNGTIELQSLAVELTAPSFMHRISLVGADAKSSLELALNSSSQNEMMNLSDPNFLEAVANLFRAISESRGSSSHLKKAAI